MNPAGSTRPPAEAMRGGVRRKDTKPPPPTGPGSKVIALPPEVKRHVLTRPAQGKVNFFVLDFDTNSAKALPPEVYKNEEIMSFATRLNAQNNRIKKLPRAISALQGLREIDLRNNSMSTLPRSVSRLKALTQLDVSGNSLRSLPPTLHQASD